MFHMEPKPQEIRFWKSFFALSLEGEGGVREFGVRGSCSESRPLNPAFSPTGERKKSPSTAFHAVPLPSISRGGMVRSAEAGALDDAFELWEGGGEIVHLRGVEEGEIKAVVDNRADRPALALDLVAADMLVIELEAGMAEEIAGLQAGHPERGRAGADAVEALDHRGDLGRAHVGAEVGDLA